MRNRDRFLALVTVLLAIGAIKVAQQFYRYYAFAEERATLARLEQEVEVAGLGVIDTQLRADSLRRAIERADGELGLGRTELDGYEQQILRGPITRAAESMYRDRLARYNDGVRLRNELYGEWRRVVDTNRFHVEWYNALVDSIRVVATVMGEPYYPVPSPAELVVRREAALP